MEVYTAAYDLFLNVIMEPRPLILNENSFDNFSTRNIIMIGDGVNKAKEILNCTVMKWIDSMPTAADMTALAEKAFRENEFIDTAYSTPFYLKGFQATTPKKNIFS